MLSPMTVLQERYRIEERVGRGGMGAVYQARDLRLGMTVAVKQIPPSAELVRAAFEREARLLATLRHPALPRVTDHFHDAAGQFLVMDYVPGDDLADQLARQGGPFPVADVLGWADQLLDALSYLHGQLPPVLHRDIKPHNLKVASDGRIMLLDFGLAKGTVGRTLPEGSLAGYTLRYAPLEQIRGEGTEPRSDLYALAATLTHWLTGSAPPDALQRAAAVLDGQPDPLAPLDTLNPQVTPMVAAVLRQALALTVAQRPASARAMRAALTEAAGDRPTLHLVPRPSSLPVTEPATEDRLARPTTTPLPPPDAPTGGGPPPTDRVKVVQPSLRRPVWWLAGGGVVVLGVLMLGLMVLGSSWRGPTGILPTAGTVTATGTAAPAPTAPPASMPTPGATPPGQPPVASPQPSGAGQPAPTQSVQAAGAVVAGHPRLWLGASDLPRLRAWAADSNPVYKEGLAVLGAKAKQAMDAGEVPGRDTGQSDWVEYPTEQYALLFAFLSLVADEPAARDDYARRARTLLMHTMHEAAKGPARGQPFRDDLFAIGERSYLWGDSFALTVDWIYPHLSAADKATIRQVFLRWADEQLRLTPDPDHPAPAGLANDPALVADRARLRAAGNRSFTAHARNLGLMALALDPADDPNGELRGYLPQATGAWLYTVDHLLRTDARGGLVPQGYEANAQSMGNVAQLLLAFHTAGQADAATHGRQVVLAGHPFWDELVAATLHSLSPAPAPQGSIGLVYLPAWFGEGSIYRAPDFIGVFGPLGLYDAATANGRRLEALRWFQTHAPPGGASALAGERVARAMQYRDAILYFLLFDPSAPPPADPRPALPLIHVAAGIGRVLARTGWGVDATWFTFAVGYGVGYRQHGDANQFEFYRRGEWLTKERTGDGPNIAVSEYHNTLALENAPPVSASPEEYRRIIGQRGSQWADVAAGDGRLLAQSSGQGYLYALGDATARYNSTAEQATDIIHASRSIVWLQPDHVLIFDRAASRTANRFKRFWLNLPATATVSGNRTTTTTARGQQLVVTTLLPTDAALTVEPAEPLDQGSEVADQEPMRFRLRVEAPGGPASVRFLHVLQGADAGATPDPVTLVQTTSGTPFAGALVKGTLVLFPVELGGTVTELAYTAPAGATVHLITGLTPNANYDVTLQPAGDGVAVRVSPGATVQADSGGVLTLRR